MKDDIIFSLVSCMELRVKLSQAINIEGLALDKFLEHQVTNSGWAIEKREGKGQFIVIPRNEFNDPASKKNAADSVPLEQITRIFPILGWDIWGSNPWHTNQTMLNSFKGV